VTPTASRVASTAAVQASPHYQTTRRHSLYGTEDRIVIDPGSRIWRVGFSGEGRPRDVFAVGPLWDLHRAADLAEREEEERVLEAKMQEHLRGVFHEWVRGRALSEGEMARLTKGLVFVASSLLTDPKSRKIIIVEHPLLPVYIKEMLAKILFGNVQVRVDGCRIWRIYRH
jgi:actin-related protein 10